MLSNPAPRVAFTVRKTTAKKPREGEVDAASAVVVVSFAPSSAQMESAVDALMGCTEAAADRCSAPSSGVL